MKATGLARYKLVVHVTVGQRAGQAVRLASRGLWDASTDSFVSETYENETMFASAQVVRYPCWRYRTSTNSSSLTVRHLHRMRGEIGAHLRLYEAQLAVGSIVRGNSLRAAVSENELLRDASFVHFAFTETRSSLARLSCTRALVLYRQHCCCAGASAAVCVFNWCFVSFVQAVS